MIYTGTAETKKIYVGSTEVKSVYRGSDLIWSGFDADAAAYIALVEADLGYAISPVQREALNVFYKGEKLSGRYALHRRIYLPIWANEEANRICMISLLKGSYVGAGTHGDGWYRNNFNGYFNIGSSTYIVPATNRTIGVLTMDNIGNTNNWAFGVGSQGLNRIAALTGGSAIAGGSTSLLYTSSSNGVYATSFNGTALKVLLRNSSEFSLLASEDIPYVGPLAGSPFLFTCRNNNNNIISATQYSNARYGVWFKSLFIDDENVEQLSLNLKTLWETCTGLTLP